MTYLRFGVRDLLWAMVVVGLVIDWRAKHAENRELRDEIWWFEVYLTEWDHIITRDEQGRFPGIRPKPR